MKNQKSGGILNLSLFGRLAQLARALLSHGRGHEFESRTAHHLILQGYFGQVLLGSPKCSFIFSAKFRSASLESTLLLIWYGRAKKTFRWPCLESFSYGTGAQKRLSDGLALKADPERQSILSIIQIFLICNQISSCYFLIDRIRCRVASD